MAACSRSILSDPAFNDDFLFLSVLHSFFPLPALLLYAPTLLIFLQEFRVLLSLCFIFHLHSIKQASHLQKEKKKKTRGRKQGRKKEDKKGLTGALCFVP